MNITQTNIALKLSSFKRMPLMLLLTILFPGWINAQNLEHKSDIKTALDVFYGAYEAERADRYKSLEKVQFSMEGTIANPRQTYDLVTHSVPKNERETFLGHWFYDIPNQLYRQYTRENYFGEHDLRWEELRRKDTTYNIATQMRRYNRSLTEFQSSLSDIIYIPGWFLLELEQDLANLSWIGSKEFKNEMFEVIELEWMNSRRRIWIDQSSRFIRRITWLSPDLILGDRQNSIEFVDRIQIDNYLLPKEIIGYLDNEATLKRKFTSFKSPDKFDEKVFELDPDLKPHATEAWSILQVSKHVHEIQGVGGNLYTIPFVVFSDFILIYDAILSPALMNRAIAIIEDRFDKPIKYVVLSHNHTDHIRGLKAFKSRDVTILTTHQTKARIKQLMNAPSRLLAVDRSVSEEGNYKVITIPKEDLHHLTDGSLTIEIHNSGTSPHVEDLVYVYVKQDDVIIQADSYFKFSKWGKSFDYLLSWIKKRGYSNPLITGVHHGPVPFEELIRRKKVQKGIIPDYLNKSGLKIE